MVESSSCRGRRPGSSNMIKEEQEDATTRMWLTNIIQVYKNHGIHLKASWLVSHLTTILSSSSTSWSSCILNRVFLLVLKTPLTEIVESGSLTRAGGLWASRSVDVVGGASTIATTCSSLEVLSGVHVLEVQECVNLGPSTHRFTHGETTTPQQQQEEEEDEEEEEQEEDRLWKWIHNKQHSNSEAELCIKNQIPIGQGGAVRATTGATAATTPVPYEPHSIKTNQVINEYINLSMLRPLLKTHNISLNQYKRLLHKNNRFLKLKLSDGFHSIGAIEYRPIPFLSPYYLLFIKKLIIFNCPISNHNSEDAILLLQHANVQLLPINTQILDFIQTSNTTTTMMDQPWGRLGPPQRQQREPPGQLVQTMIHNPTTMATTFNNHGGGDGDTNPPRQPLLSRNQHRQGDHHSSTGCLYTAQKGPQHNGNVSSTINTQSPFQHVSSGNTTGSSTSSSSSSTATATTTTATATSTTTTATTTATATTATATTARVMESHNTSQPTPIRRTTPLHTTSITVCCYSSSSSSSSSSTTFLHSSESSIHDDGAKIKQGHPNSQTTAEDVLHQPNTNWLHCSVQKWVVTPSPTRIWLLLLLTGNLQQTNHAQTTQLCFSCAVSLVQQTMGIDHGYFRVQWDFTTDGHNVLHGEVIEFTEHPPSAGSGTNTATLVCKQSDIDRILQMVEMEKHLDNQKQTDSEELHSYFVQQRRRLARNHSTQEVVRNAVDHPRHTTRHNSRNTTTNGLGTIMTNHASTNQPVVIDVETMPCQDEDTHNRSAVRVQARRGKLYICTTQTTPADPIDQK